MHATPTTGCIHAHVHTGGWGGEESVLSRFALRPGQFLLKRLLENGLKCLSFASYFLVTNKQLLKCGQSLQLDGSGGRLCLGFPGMGSFCTRF